MQTPNVIAGEKGFVSSPLESRFWVKVDIRGDDECWPWLGASDQHGRGQFWMDGRKHRSPRIAWSLRNGEPFPDHLHACHTCDNPPCCNPRHIWPGTRSDNFLDASRKGRLHVQSSTPMGDINRAKTHCKRGHEFTSSNTLVNSAGSRACKECAKIHRQKYEAARAALAQKGGET